VAPTQRDNNVIQERSRAVLNHVCIHETRRGGEADLFRLRLHRFAARAWSQPRLGSEEEESQTNGIPNYHALLGSLFEVKSEIFEKRIYLFGVLVAQADGDPNTG
jgi:hypothetical protein